MDRKSSVSTMLCLSAFILLLINPNLLFEVGYQLSYAAVASIIAFQPYFFKPFKSSSKITRFFGNIISVTFAAQLGVLPLSLFYFHQFPGLFFLTNILIIPALGIILSGGILIISLALFNILPDFLKKTYQFMLDFLMQIIDWVASKEAFLIEEIYFPIAFCLVSYAIIISAYSYLKSKRVKYLFASLFLIIAFQLYYLADHQQQINKESFTIFHQNKASIFGVREKGNYTIYTDSLGKIKSTYLIESITEQLPLNNIQYANQLQNWFQFNNSSIFVIDKIGIYDLPKNTGVDILVLIDSPKINLTRIIHQLQPKTIVADGSNYTSDIKRWQETCAQKKVPFHHTGKKGAFTLDY